MSLKDLSLYFADPQPNVVFEGISDFSELATSLVTTLTAVIRNRLRSFINAGDLTGKINSITNSVIDLVPEQVSLGNTGLYLDGWMYQNPAASQGILHVPLKTVIGTDVAEYQQECPLLELPKQSDTLEQYLQIMINGCFLNQALFAIHKENLIHFSVSNNKTTVSTVALLIGTNFKKDFDNDALCKFTFFTNSTDDSPVLTLNQTESSLTATLYLQI